MAKEVAELKAVFSADTSGFHRAVNEVHAGLDQSVGKFFNLRNMSIAAFGGMSAAAAGFAAESVQAGMAWESAMKNVQAATGRSAEENEKWSKAVLSMGTEAREGPASVAAAYYDVVSAVQDADKHLAILQAGIQLDEAGDQTTQLASTVDGLINAINAYNASADDAARFSDVYARAVQMGKGSMEEFVGAISPGLGLMSAMGVSFEEVGASIALFTTRGQTASMGMTKLEGIVNALIKPNSELTKVMQEMGVSSFKTMVETDGLRETLMQLYDALGGNEQELAKVLGTSEALQGAFLLMDESAGGFFDTYNEGIDGATGSQRSAQMESTAAKWDLLQAKVSGLSIALGSELMPALGGVLDAASMGADFFADLFGVGTSEDMPIEVPDPYAELQAAKTITVPTQVIYEVQSGDTLWGIAAAYNTSVEAILSANPNLAAGDYIYAGQQIMIPAGAQVTYTVGAGDTIWSVAAANNTSPEAILEANPQLADLTTGTTIRLDASGNATYQIKSGDTIWSVAAQNNTSVAAILDANPQLAGLRQGDQIVIATDATVDMNVAMGDLMFSQADLQMMNTQVAEVDTFTNRLGDAISNLIFKVDEMEGIDIDTAALGESLAAFNTEFQEFVTGVDGILESLGIKLPSLDAAFTNWWENSPLNPEGAISLIKDVGGAFKDFGDLVGSGMEAIGLKDEEKGVLPTAEAPIQFIADYSEYMSGDELLADYFGELSYPVLFQPAETVAPGDEMFAPGTQIDFEEAQLALDEAGLEAQVVMVPVDEAGQPIGTLSDLGITPEEAATMPIMIVPVDRDGNPIGGSIPEYFQTEADSGGGITELFMAQTTAGVDFDMEAMAQMESSVENIRAAAESPITMDISDSSFVEMAVAKAQMDAAAKDREVKLVVNIEIGAGREYIGLASAATGGSFGVEARAAGGPVNANEPYLVGERGPELIIPGTGGQVIPNDVLRQMVSGGGTSFSGNTFNFQGVNDVEAFYDALQKVARQRGA